MASANLNVKIKDETQRNNNEPDSNPEVVPDVVPEVAPEENENIQLKLGDIIEVRAPDNETLDKQTFYIDYISKKKMVLKNVETLEKKSILIDETGNLEEKSITEIALLSRDDNHGYARQNELLPDQWINIEFRGDIPFIVVGEIMNLEEDMIEVKTYPDGNTIYIDFAYQGIPEDLPIISIDKRNPPEELNAEPNVNGPDVNGPSVNEPQVKNSSNSENDFEEAITPEIDYSSPEVELSNVILEGDDIVFGEDLGTIEQEVEIAKSKMRFGIQNQVDDMLDELLASIPENKRTRNVLNQLHTEIERYKQLRNKFSVFDENGNAMMPIQKTATHKPLANAMENFQRNMRWILPVTTNRKYLYDIDEDEADELEDVIVSTLEDTLTEMTDAFDLYYKNNIPDGENKYKYLMGIINRFSAPFTSPEEYKRSGIVFDGRVHVDADNILSVVNNFDEYTSSVAESGEVMSKKYQLTPYLHGDKISAKSLLVLPENTFRYSRIYLPETSILDRAHYNTVDLYTYQLLQKKLIPETVQIKMNDDTPIEYNAETFFDSILEIVPEDNEDAEANWREYLDKAIPKTRVFFDLIKKYVRNNVTFYDIVNELEPFMVYHDDITYKQYQEMTKFIAKKILDYKKRIQEKSRDFKTLHFGKKYARRTKRAIFDLVHKIKNDANEPVSKELLFDESKGYKLPFIKIGEFEREMLLPLNVDSEILHNIYTKDQGRAFFSEINFSNKDLISVSDLSEIIKRVRVESAARTEDFRDSSECKSTRIVKVYTDLDSLLDDNYKEIYHDKTLDQTHYDIIENYADLRETMSEGEFKQHLITELENNIGLSTINAVRDAEAMISGKRIVINGEYCVLNAETEERSYYYRRVNDSWQRDESVSSSDFEDQKMICNLRKDCTSIRDPKKKKSKDANSNHVCSDVELAEALLEETAMEKLIQAFNIDLEISRSELLDVMQNNKNYRSWKLSMLNWLNVSLRENKNNSKYIFALNHYKRTDTDVTSPRVELLDKIMGDTNMVDKNRNISDFVYYMTRPANEQNGEDIHWLYCKETNIKLLPQFISELANAFNQSPTEYYSKVEELCATIGKLSDDGDAWVDKHSGYIIKKVDFDTEEGFEEGGYKKVTREILEEDLSVQTAMTGEKEYTDPSAKMINNVINAMASFMGININSVRDFIIQNTMLLIEKLLPPEAEYIRKMEALEKKGKKVTSYETTYNTALLMTSLAYYHIAALTMVPSIRTKKQFPGCVKAFTGYPLGGSEDMSGLAYVVCVANKIKSSTAPWSVMKRMNEKSIMKRVKDIIHKYLIDSEEVREKIMMKTEYLSTKESEAIPDDISVLNWSTFLPPLALISRVVKVDTIPKIFMQEFEKQSRKGSKAQYTGISVLESKAMHYSHEIISHIQNIIQKELPLLKNNAEEPFLENACCIEKTYDSISYFTSRSKDIETKNNVVRDLMEHIHAYYHAAKPNSFAIIQKDPRVYPIVNDNFRDSTIYAAFIHYCNYNSILPVPDKFAAICGPKPTGKLTGTIQERIETMKSEGKNYNREALNTLLRIISQEKVIDVDYDPVILSQEEKLRIFLTNTDADDTFMSDDMKKKLIALTNKQDDTITVGSELPSVLKDVINTVTRENSILRESVREHISIHASGSRRQKEKASTFLDSLFEWDSVMNLDEIDLSFNDDLHQGVDQSIHMLEKIASENAATERVIRFTEDMIERIGRVIPNIISQKVDFKDQSILRHWKLSERHNKDIVSLIERNYDNLVKFYEDKEITGVLQRIVEFSKNLIKFARLIPKNNNNVVNGKPVRFMFDKSMHMMLLEYVVFKIFALYILFVDQPVLHIDDAEVSAERDLNEVGAIVSNLVQDTEIGEMEEIDIVTGRVAAASVKLGDLFVEICDIFNRDKKTINYNHQDILERVNISKEKEKDMVTQRLKDMSDEERQVENLLKAHKLGQWNKGLLKGLTQYVPGTYDEERAVMEAQAEMERRLGKDDRVTEMNREIYATDIVDAEMVDDAIEREEMDLVHLGDDDDFGDMDGDEFF